ncbi:hypothetical protein PspLS_08849 [Pyricularia sp. CBS 133598]|nr:hypothetical protein PspLS_08849 [Pyricularia sp. CBS 133598]
MVLSGHCLCKAVTYKVDVDAPLITGYDHCDDCQRQSGSTYSLVVVVPKDKLTINGPTKSWAGKGSSGKAVHRIFCGECGSPIAHDPDAAPEIIAIKGGTLDAEIKKTLKPDTEIWTVGKLPFCQEHLAKPFTHMPDNGKYPVKPPKGIGNSGGIRWRRCRAGHFFRAVRTSGTYCTRLGARKSRRAGIELEASRSGSCSGPRDGTRPLRSPGRVIEAHLGLKGSLVLGPWIFSPRCCGDRTFALDAGRATRQRGRNGAEDCLEDGRRCGRGGWSGQKAAQHRGGGRGDGLVEGVVGVVEKAAGAAGGPLGEKGAPAETLGVGVQVQRGRAVWVAERLGRFDGDARRDYVPHVEDRRPADGIKIYPL